MLNSTHHGQIPIAPSRNTPSPNGSTRYGHYRSFMSNFQRTLMGFNSNIHAHIICVSHTHERKVSLKCCASYLLGILTQKRGSIANLNDKGTEFKTTTLNKACDQSASKEYFQAYFFLKRKLNEFLESIDLGWDELVPSAWYCYTIFPRSNDPNCHFSSLLVMSQQKAT